MSESEALDVLGLPRGADAQRIRRAYRRLLRSTHPDLSASADATAATVRLTVAYRTALDHLARAPVADPAGTDAPTPAQPRAHHPEVPGTGSEGVHVHLVDAETIGVAAPAGEVLPMLLDAAHRVGEVSYLDPAAGLLEIVVEFVDAPTSSVVLSMQGRATGTTDVFCTVEPLSGGPAPSAAAVTQLLLRTLRGEDPTT